METTRSYCNDCAGDKNHAILHKESDSGSEAGGAYEWAVVNETLKCLGCDHVSLRRTVYDNQDIDENGQSNPSITNFPPVAFRKKPDWHSELSFLHIFDKGKEFLNDLLSEIYICIQNDCRRSAVMAIRALIEQVMIDKSGDHGSFSKNVGEFKKSGWISDAQEDFLKTVIEAGHASMHRSYKPEKKDVISILNITESIIESAYVNAGRSASLKKRIPRKQKVEPDASGQRR